MLTYWPNVQEAIGSANYTSFWEHEWTKHGTCSGLTQVDYFQQAIALIKQFGTPKSVTNNVGSVVDANSLRNDFGGPTKVALQCAGGNYIVGAYTCWAQVNGVPQNQIDCPEEVQKEDSCIPSGDLQVAKL